MKSQKEELMTAFKENADEFVKLAKIAVKCKRKKNQTFDDFLDFEANAIQLKKNIAEGEAIKEKLFPLFD